MSTDPILDAWITAADAAVAAHPDLAPWFADREALVAATDILQGYEYDPGDRVIKKGVTERHALLLSLGSAEVLHTEADGTLSTLRLVKAPANLGTFGFAVALPRSNTVRALTSAIALRLDRKGLAQIAHNSPSLAIGLLRWQALDLARWLQETRGHRDPWARKHGMIGGRRTFDSVESDRVPLAGAELDRARARVAEVRCFQGVSAESLLDGVGTQVQLVRTPQGGAVVSHADADRSLLVLLDGQASVRTTDSSILARFNGNATLSAELLIGELGFLTRGGRDGTVIADTDCTLLEIPHAALPWLVDHDPALAFRIHVALLRTLCWRLREQDIDRDQTSAILSGDLDAWLS